MRLVTGGAWQGKKTWVMSNWAIDEDDMVDGAKTLECQSVKLSHMKAVNHLHLLVKHWMNEGLCPEDEMQRLLELNPELIVITDEIGCGIVPMDRNERLYRELHGRLCCKLAGQAEQVVRVVCGIGQRIK